MSTIIWVDPATPLPSARQASTHGLLAAGADLSVERLTEAYSKGIFPWFNEGDPVLWWSPDPRMLLKCDDLRISRSLGKLLRRIERTERQEQAPVQVTVNMAFSDVIRACAEPADKREVTWISPDVQDAYLAWHHGGHAHSVEVWHDGVLAGGLYGVCMGRMFFGESMFSRVSDSSKVALVYLTRLLQRMQIRHIDCQQETRHLASMGARPVRRDTFLELLEQALAHPTPAWPRGQLYQSGQFASQPDGAP